MYQNSEPEWHPWLKMFTIMAVPARLIFLVPSLIDIYDNLFMNFGTGNYSSDITFLIMGCLILFISIRTLKITDFFRKWNNGISQRDRVIAYYAMVMGFGVCLGLFFATPITRLFTDTIGGGRRN